MKNFNMFRKLCGEGALKNVVIVTNRWGEVEPRVGEAREAELAGDDLFFKPAIDNGARMARHEDTLPSAERIIRLMLENRPLPLRIQEELVTERKDITKTDAGEELDRELVSQVKKYEQELQVLVEDIQEAIRGRDEETKMELEAETQKVKEQIEKLEKDRKRLKSDYEDERRKLETAIRQIESTGMREVKRASDKHPQQINHLKRRLGTNSKGSDDDDWIAIPIYE